MAKPRKKGQPAVPAQRQPPKRKGGGVKKAAGRAGKVAGKLLKGAGNMGGPPYT